MGNATPPEQIADEWNLQKSTLKKADAAAKKLPAGGTLSDPRPFYFDKLTKAQQTLTHYWFDTCA